MLTGLADASGYIAAFVLLYCLEEALVALWDRSRSWRIRHSFSGPN